MDLGSRNQYCLERKLIAAIIIFTFPCLLLLVGSAAPTHVSSYRMIPQISHEASSSPVKLTIFDKYVEIDNGIVNLWMTKPGGKITAIGYKGIGNLLEYHNKETQRGYWDITWQRPDIGIGSFETLEGTSFRVIAETKDQVEVSFRQTWHSHDDDMAPLNIDKRYIVLRGVSGFYSYAIFEHMEGWPELNIDEARIAFKLSQDLFHYMAISDDKQRIMPTNRDREAGHQLDYKESVLLTNPENPEHKGEVDDKYQYSLENKDNHVHGWISLNKHIGFWVITPSDEFRAGGPLKPDLTSHVGPTCLSAFFSGHYAGRDFGVRLQDGEPWKKVFGPVFMYLNSHSTNLASSVLWEDAKKQMSIETSKWPYDFPMSRDFPKANQRGTITGRLFIYERYLSREPIPAKYAYIGLAAPGEVGSWQHEAKGYQFWTQTNDMGYFTIKGIRAGTYTLYAWVPGFLGDYKHGKDIIIKPDTYVQMGNLLFTPLRDGPTVWEIGIPDKSAAEFYIPDPAPGLVNKLFGDKDKFRQYGLWDRYTDLYPTQDLSYTIGVNNYRKDWFFAHVNRKMDEYNYTPTTWRILFELRNVYPNGVYILRLALASATDAHVQVRINNPNGRPYFGTRQIGKDNAIARHGIHGQYWLFSIELYGSLLYNGENAIYLTQVKTASGPFNGVMYDYIRLEGPCAPKY